MEVLRYFLHKVLFVAGVLKSSLFLWTILLAITGISNRTCMSLPVLESTSYPNIATTDSNLMLEQALKQARIEDEGCHITVWDSTSPYHVHQVNGRCKEGLLSWKSPYGAVRLTLGGRSGHYPNGMEVCFNAKSNFTRVKISLERNDGNEALNNANPLGPLVTLNGDDNEETKFEEICFRSTHRTVTLYLEADHDLNSYTIGVVELEYSVDNLEKSSSSSHDPEEDCRPCSEKEILTAVCTKDFVVGGRLESIENRDGFSETAIHVTVNSIYRQIENYFSTKSIFDSSHQRNTYNRQNSNSNFISKYTNTIFVPKVCGVHKGEGLFLFLGRFRLGKAILQCAPRLEEFTQMWHKALQNRNNPCTIKWKL